VEGTLKPLFTSILFLSFLSLNPVLADIITVSGDVSGTWSADTVLVVGEVRVPTDSTLTIEPGVKVIFQGHYKLIVDTLATLLAVGTDQDSILFTAADTSEGWHGIRFYSAEDSCRLEYCNITHGLAVGSEHEEYGGGIYLNHSNPTVLNCSITNCHADLGGGGIYCDYSNPVINYNSIDYNSVGGSTEYSGGGGGIYCVDSNPVINCNSIQYNTVNSTLYYYGGGIYCYQSDPVIIGNNIKGNSIDQIECAGGGIYCRYSTPMVINNTISENSADSGGGLFIYRVDSTEMIIENNTIINNTALPYGIGGGISYWCYGPVRIENNVIKWNSSRSGGGISLSGSSAVVVGNEIVGNYAPTNFSGGGGLYIDSYTENMKIYRNLICSNTSEGSGGGIRIGGSNDNVPEITQNIIMNNHTYSGGGGIECGSYNFSIAGNILCNNSTEYGAGGLIIYSYSVFENMVAKNILLQNSANYGGAVEIHGALTLSKCVVTGNTAEYGAGVYIVQTNMDFVSVSIVSNSASLYGGGVSQSIGFANYVNSILWANTPDQVYNSVSANSYVFYSDIQDTLWPGIGNISDDPMFVNPSLNDYRLQWGSPCIDTGNPDPQYNDPDGTRADMGAFYFDQSVPVRILLSPHEIPYLIPAEGGTMDYTIRGENIENLSHTVTVWCDVELPDSTIYGPVIGPVTLTIEPGQTVERIRTQTVPASAPMGIYHYHAYAVVDSDTSKDSFMFGKLGTAVDGIDGWGNAGDPLIANGSGSTSIHQATEFALFNAYPNPFNPATTISFALPKAGKVTLTVFDVNGRLVSTLVDGYRNAGVHEVTFDGSNLSSGIYLYRLETGQFTVSGKMMLMK
jgi:hypothetical protein